jgi:HEAT repeat protein
LRKIFSNKQFDENLYHISASAINRIPPKNTSLDDDLIEILKDEKPLMEKMSRKEKAGKSEQELKLRYMNVWFIIEKLGQHKNTKAVPLLKEFLSMPEFQYYASEALAQIGDKSAKEELRERASKGEEVNYGGMVEDETDAIFKDLQDETKKDKWGKLAKQLIHIRSPRTKLALRKLFDHKSDFVRNTASMAFFNMVTKDDANDLVELVKHRDFVVRTDAVKAMMYLRDVPFDDVLLDVLVNDRDGLVRSKAARALGMKKVQKAVPYLENALNDEDYYVRLEAFISLYVLTDKKYDFKGRNENADYLAEQQKKFPKINW